MNGILSFLCKILKCWGSLSKSFQSISSRVIIGKIRKFKVCTQETVRVYDVLLVFPLPLQLK